MKKYLIFLMILTLSGCKKDRYNTGHFQDNVINFEDANSVYDDYNSTAPFIYFKYLFHFSSNRESLGDNFDIVGENMFIDWSKVDGTLEIGTDRTDDRFDYLIPMFDSLNTPCDELGPYSLGFWQDISSTEKRWTDLIMYANNCDGNFDIKFIYAELINNPDTAMIHQSQKISFLNSEANDMYPTFFGNDFFYHDEWGVDAAKIE